MTTQMETLFAFLEQHAPDLEQPMDQIRATYETMIAAQPVVDGYTRAEITLGGIACTSLTAPQPGDALLLYLHGGGYMLGSGACYAGVASGFAAAFGADAISVDYPLAPEAPAPAAQNAALAVYRALLERGHDAKRIVVAGDSAGGGLTMALLLALKAQALPMPAAACLISPWVDLTLSHSSMVSRAEADFLLSKEALGQMAGAFLAGGADARDPAISPLFGDLTGLPPIMIQVGTAEVLLDDALELAKALAHADVTTDLRVWPGMPHDWTLFAQILDEGKQAQCDAGAFLARYL